MIRRTVRTAALLLTASAAWAGALTSQWDISRIPMSGRIQGGEPLYSGFDVFRSFENPALLGLQSRTWELSATNLSLMGGSENTWALGASWASPQTASGTFAVSLMGGGFSMDSFKEIDLSGNPTGVLVEPSAYTMGMAVMYQWSFISFGGAMLSSMQSFGDLPETMKEGVDIPEGLELAQGIMGVAATLGRLSLGGSYGFGPEKAMRFGGAIHFWGDRAAVGLDLTIPSREPLSSYPEGQFMENPSDTGDGYNNGNSGDVYVQIGSVVELHEKLTLRVGVSAMEEPFLRVGFTVPWGAWAFDYGFGMDLGGGMPGHDALHHLAVTWRAGRERKMPTGPQFMLTARERTLAVGSFEAQGVGATDAAIISDMLRNRLIKEGSFNVVEKANMDRILAEQAFQQTGCTSQECAVKLGKILNVRYLVVGSFGKLLGRYVISLRVVEVETARAVYSDEAQAPDVPGIQEAISKMAENLTAAVQEK